MSQENHNHCIQDVTSIARARCHALNLRLTNQRLAVLQALAADHRAHGAYDLIAPVEGATAKRLSPTAIYRALEFWQQAGLVHKIGGLDRFCVCFNAADHHRHFVVCCDTCFTVKELCDHRAGFDLTKALEPLGFAANQASQIEVVARCRECSTA